MQAHFYINVFERFNLEVLHADPGFNRAISMIFCLRSDLNCRRKFIELFLISSSTTSFSWRVTRLQFSHVHSFFKGHAFQPSDHYAYIMFPLSIIVTDLVSI